MYLKHMQVIIPVIFLYVLSKLFNMKLKIKKDLIRKNENMDEEFQQHYYSRTAKVFFTELDMML